MKKTVRFLSFVLIFAVLFSTAFSSASFAANTVEGPTISATVIKNENADNILTVELGFLKNPGIGAMTFTLKYDKDVFSTIAFTKRKFYYNVALAGYLIVDHPEDGFVSVVWAEEGGKTYDATGTFVKFDFSYKNAPGKYDFKIANINPKLYGEDLTGCFANLNHDKFVSAASNDTFTIYGDENNPCKVHSFEFSKKIEANCLSDGYSLYKCSFCGKTEKRETVKALGHDFEDFWTVDRAAENSVTMMLSRHCSRCNETKDITYFTLDRVKELKIKNKVGTKVYESDIKELVKTEDKPSVVPKEENTENKHISDKIPFYDEGEKTLDEPVESAEEIIKDNSYFYFDGIKLPKKVKTAGDFFAKAFIYLFGTKGKCGLITVIINSFKHYFG